MEPSGCKLTTMKVETLYPSGPSYYKPNKKRAGTTEALNCKLTK